MDEWGRERAPELADIFAIALPGEFLTPDELLACCWDDPGVVLGTPDGSGAVAACVRRSGERVTGYLKLVAVVPASQRKGRGRALVGAAEEWLRAEGALTSDPGPSAPYYLWPGVDTSWTRALCLFEDLGYRPNGAELNLSCPSTYRAPDPVGASTGRVLDDGQAEAVVAFTTEHFGSNWVSEVSRSLELGTCFAAVDDASGAIAGFACHSVNRIGWFGPTGTHPGMRRRGIGAALLGAVCADLQSAGRADVEIAWIGPVGFYARAAGASVSRVFRRVIKPLA